MTSFRLLGKDCNDQLLHGGHFGGGINEDAAAQQSKDAIIYVTVRDRVELLRMSLRRWSKLRISSNP